jgi:tetratricopeptide (TPR) repeat protein
VRVRGQANSAAPTGRFSSLVRTTTEEADFGDASRSVRQAAITAKEPALKGWCLRLLLASCCVLQSCSASTEELPSPHSPKLSCSERLQLGKQLEAQGANADALKTYEPCLDSYPETIALLGRRYAPARQALERRRDELVLSVNHSLDASEDPANDVLTLLVALNRELDRSAENMALFDRALALPAVTKTAQTLHGFLWEDLVRLGRYADVLRWEDEVRTSIDGAFLMARVSRSEPSYELNVKLAVEESALYARALAASGRAEDARNVLKRATELEAIANEPRE